MYSKLFETTLKQLGAITSGITQKSKEDRQQYQNAIHIYKVLYNSNNNFLQLNFKVYPTKNNLVKYGPSPAGLRVDKSNNKYTVMIRFLNVNALLENWQNLDKSNKTLVIKNIVDICDIQFYSNDPSFYHQGCWEKAEKYNVSIYKFPGPSGNDVWSDRHQLSGELSKDFYITKHISQVLDTLSGYYPAVIRQINKTISL